MSQSQNISTRNALARLTMGLSMLAYGTAKLSRNPQCNKGRLLVALGAMKAAEGTVKYCPMKAMMQQSGMTGHTGVPEVGQLMKDFASKGMDMASGGSTAGGTMANAAMGVAGMAANAMSGNASTGTGMESGNQAGNSGNANKTNGSSTNNTGMSNGTGVVGTKAGWSSS
ncbi:MAG: DUF2892 domain-containing protein [Planococcaceae bacterium]|nr:DUF2892 domain-containing protein [Planococcaceae bacterium]